MSDNSASKQVSDRDLMIRLHTGHSDALDVIYDRYVSLVYTLALKIVANPEEAEDLTQEAFVSLWQRQQYDSERGNLGSYLATYIRSRALDRVRVRHNRLRILRHFQQQIQPKHPAETPLDAASQQERSQQIRDALSQLPATEREVLEIAYFEGYSQSKIAKRLGIPLGTVKTRSRKGLVRLRNLMHPND